MKSGRLSRLDILVPGMLLAAFLCDAACRFVRLEPLTFRADEALTQFRSAWKPGPFEANRRYRNERTSGDLPILSNQVEYRVFREQTFTTDELGFRNAVEPGSARPAVMMLGDSFTYGSGNTDSQTLPARVAALSGCGTYNAAGMNVRSQAILQVARGRGMVGGLIIIDCLERHIGSPMDPRMFGRWVPWLPYREDLVAIFRTVEDRLAISPVQVMLRRSYKSFQDDRILPNIHKDAVEVRHLKDGRPSLFLGNIEDPKQFYGISQNVDSYVMLRDDLKAAGFDLALVMVPEKLTVYRSLLREALPRDGESLAFLAEFERSVRDQNIPVVNLAPILVDAARLAFERGEILYWPDDSHWNPSGIEVAARAICDALDLRARCRSKPG